ncbi:MAG: terminase small subunit [Rhodospirillaceae bacterium]
MGKVVSLTELCEILGVVPMTISRLEDKGFPCIERGVGRTPSKYDTQACIQWLIKYEMRKLTQTPEGEVINYEDERARLTREQADKVAMENEERRGRLVDSDKVGMWWATLVSNAKTRFLAIPTKAAPLVFGAKTMPQVRDHLERLIVEVLSELSSANPVPDLESDAGVASAAAVDREPVGGPVPEAKPRKQRRARSVAD